MKRVIAVISAVCMLGCASVYAEGENIFFKDYKEEIAARVAEIIETSNGLNEELDRIEALDTEYDSIILHKAETQSEMNSSSYIPYQIWDTELNSLWGRLEKALGEGQMQAVRDDEVNWISIKDKVAEEALISFEGGSMYPMMLNGEKSRITRNRAYHIASLLAEASGEAFELPAHDIVGTYVDNQGTDSVYSSLIISQNMENDYTASLTIFRLMSEEGTVTENGDGLLFNDEESGLTGKITFGWDGAVFTVTSASGPLNEGEVFEFPMVL